MKQVIKFLSLNSKEKFVFFEAGILLTISSIGICAIPFKHIENIMLARWFLSGHRPDASTDQIKEQINLVRHSVSRAANTLPWKIWCLSRSIATFIMLRRRNVPAVFLAGVKFDVASMRAHSWICAGSDAAAEAQEVVEFTPLIKIESPVQSTGPGATPKRVNVL